MAEESKIIINNNNSNNNNNNNNQAMQSFSQRGGSLNVNAQEFNFQKKGGGAQSKSKYRNPLLQIREFIHYKIMIFIDNLDHLYSLCDSRLKMSNA